VQNVNARLRGILNAVGVALGKTVVIFSGHRTDAYSNAVGGFAGDPHTQGIAVDATIDGRPIGSYPGAVAIIHKFGARSGATDFQYNGKSDPAHVDLVGSAGATQNAAAATGSSIDSPDTFWYAVETKLGLPHTRSTHAFLVSWATVENTKAAFNPLATTMREPGSTGLAGNRTACRTTRRPRRACRRPPTRSGTTRRFSPCSKARRARSATAAQHGAEHMVGQQEQRRGSYAVRHEPAAQFPGQPERQERGGLVQLRRDEPLQRQRRQGCRRRRARRAALPREDH
jgi:hypothetical protein